MFHWEFIEIHRKQTQNMIKLIIMNLFRWYVSKLNTYVFTLIPLRVNITIYYQYLYHLPGSIQLDENEYVFFSTVFCFINCAQVGHPISLGCVMCFNKFNIFIQTRCAPHTDLWFRSYPWCGNKTLFLLPTV